MAIPFSRTCLKNESCILNYVRLCCLRYASSNKRKSQGKESNQLQVKFLFGKPVNEKPTTAIKSSSCNTYREFLDFRHSQASRSVLIRVHRSPEEVCEALQGLGPIQSAFSIPKVKNYLLVEFKNKQTLDKLLSHVSYFKDQGQIPIRSRLLYYMQGAVVQRHRSSNLLVPEVVTSREFVIEDCLTAESVSSQMKELHDVKQLSDVGYRLRFLICSMVEDLVRPSLPFCRIDPFGSSSNSFGWEGCDLDMMMTLKPENIDNTGARFLFLTKKGSEEERVYGKQCLDVVGEMVRAFMPSAFRVNKVLNARVPIVKFQHEATEIDCDLSYANLSGAKMSELMHLLGQLDPRVRPLMTTVKHWARACELTRPHPGPWPANFTLLSLLIFYLQTCQLPVLPSLRLLQELAGPADHFLIEDIDYAFVTDINKIPQSANQQSLEEHLHGFFHFISHFDFATRGLSLIEASAFPKAASPASSDPLLIENPLDLCHNVGRNVGATYVTKMQELATEALRCIESKSVPSPEKPWGLFCLFQPPSHPSSSAVYSVADLFEKDQQIKDCAFETDELKKLQELENGQASKGDAAIS